MNNNLVSIFLIYLTGLFQGIAFVTFPAAGTLFTNPKFQNLSPSEYGGLFIPMICGAILSSLVGGNLGAKRGLRSILFYGLSFNVLSLALFAFTHSILAFHDLNYALLLLALLFLGLGFGATLTTLNAYVAEFFSSKISTGLTALHSLLGSGTALAPLLLNFFIKENFWWGDPLLLALIFVFLIVGALLTLQKHKGTSEISSFSQTPAKGFSLFGIYMGIVFLYGICETIFGNWSTIYLHSEKGLTAPEAAWALSLFWAMVTVGRVLITGLSFWIKPEKILLLLPFLILMAFLLIPYLEGVGNNLFMLGFAGIACSACLPLSIGFAEQDFPQHTSIVSGRLMAFSMLGYGFAAYGAGLLQQHAHFSLSEVFSYSAVLAGVMALAVAFLLLKT